MRVLITGGAGFVGSHLAEALLERGDEVSVLDDLSTGSIDNIAHLKSHPNFHYKIDSVTNEPLLAEMIDRCETVIHLAAAVGVKLIVEAPVRTIETNVHGTEVVLKIANKKKRLVLIASTSEVYGKSAVVPFREDADLVLGPTSKHRWAYACSKMIDEFLALAYWKERKLPVIVVRLFNTVGPRQTTITGSLRSFQYASARNSSIIFNIGNGVEISIADLATRIKELTGSRSSIVTIPYDQAYEAGFEDMPRRVPDISKIRALVGYEPTVQLDEILTRVIASLRT